MGYLRALPRRARVVASRAESAIRSISWMPCRGLPFACSSPAAHVRRPQVDYESDAVALDCSELGGLLVTAGVGPPLGHRTLTITCKGAGGDHPAGAAHGRTIGLAIGERTEGPVS
jgi:hypothetical protein